MSFFLTAQTKVTVIDLDTEITALSPTNNGRLLYGTANGQFGTYDGVLLDQLGTVGAQINRIDQQNGTISILSKAGLYTYDEQLKNISGSHLDVLATDGNMLFTRSGVFTKKGNKYVLANTYNIVADNELINAKIQEHKQDQLLLLDQKLYKKDKWWSLKLDSVIDISCNDSRCVILNTTGIYSLHGETLYTGNMEHDGRVYLTKNNIVYYTDQNILYQLKDGYSDAKYSILTDKVRAITEDRWDNVWIAAADKLYRVSTIREPGLPLVEIKSINNSDITDYKPLKGGETLSVEYDGVHLTHPQSLVFQSKLEGHTDWSTPTRDKNITYPNIPSGSYQYRLRATVDGSNYTYIDPISITIRDNTFSWIGLVLLLIGIFILALAYWLNHRWNQYKSKVAQDRAALLKENKLLTLEQKALQLQMNPHFIFNALNSIKGLIAQGENKKARQSLTAFANLMRDTLNQSRSETTTIADEANYLDRYLALEQWIGGDRLKYIIEIDEHLDSTIEIPTMLIQPFVENSIKHAFKGEVKNPMIAIRFYKKERTLFISIEDNGVGISGTIPNKNHQSIATKLVKERLELIYQIRSTNSVNIESPAPSGQGVLVTLKLPIKSL